MSVPVHVEAYSGHRANERPLRFTLDKEIYEIADIEDRWYDPNAEYFRVRTADSRRYILRCDREHGQWTLQSGFDGDALLARPGTVVVLVGSDAIRQAVSGIVGCEECRGEQAGIPFERMLEGILDKHGPYEFVLPETVTCPACGAAIIEKTLVQPEGDQVGNHG